MGVFGCVSCCLSREERGVEIVSLGVDCDCVDERKEFLRMVACGT